MSGVKTKQKPSRPQIGVTVIVRRSGKLLLQNRRSAHANKHWGLPGGHLELWEEPEQCALRELEEEAGSELIVKNLRFFAIENVMFKKEKKQYLTMFYVADWISGEAIVTEPKKCRTWEWFKWNALPTPLMPGIRMLHDMGKNPFKKELCYQRIW